MALKPCKECGQEVSTKAKTCPNCGAPAKGGQTQVGCGTGCVVLVLVFLLIGYLANTYDPSPTERSTRTKSFMAKVSCEGFVKAQLKAPSTAEFPEPDVAVVGADTFRVTGYVDAENAFGARLRNTYVCETIYNGEGTVRDDSNWTLEDLQLSD